MHDFDRFRDNIADVILFNRIMNIDMVGVDETVEFIAGNKDIGELTSLPDFLESSLVAGFSPKPPSKEEDYRLRTLFGTLDKKGLPMNQDDSARFLILWEEWARKYNNVESLMQKEYDQAVHDLDLHPDDGELLCRKSVLYASLKEIVKLQLLIGAPLFHHVLSIDTHYVHSVPPESFKNSPVDFSFVKSLGAYMREKSSYSSEQKEFKLPIGTSQGLTLKSARDTSMWRAFSKVILALYAVKSDQNSHLQEFKDRINYTMLSRGYDEIAQHAFLGLRRQQLAYSKEEPAPMLNSLGMDGYSNVLITRKLQGRARAIFPFSETVKAWFKPLADGVKKHLFLETCMHATDPIRISNALHKITQLSIDGKLIDKDGGFYTFYDLSAYDRTTHNGLNDLYELWLQAYDPNFDSRYKIMHNDAGIIYPLSCDRDPMICLETIEGRSTLSGQADVTVKNNVIHFIIAIGLISHIKGWDAMNVAKALMYNEGPHKDECIGLIHGDDAAVYFSDKPEDYEEFARLFTELGVVTGFESAPVYLKKVVDFKNAAMLRNVSISSVKAAKTGLILAKGNKSQIMSNDSYNAKYMHCMIGITGSLLKNRFGEYPQQDIILGLISILDTFKLMNETDVIRDEITSLYDTQLELLLGYYDLLMSKGKVTQCISDDGVESTSIIDSLRGRSVKDLANDGKIQSLLVQYMHKMVTLNTPKAQQMRQTISKIVHTLGEEFLDDELRDIYSLTNYDVLQEAESFGIQNMTRETLLDAICMFQEYILDHEGLCPDQNTVDHIMQSVDKTAKSSQTL